MVDRIAKQGKFSGRHFGGVVSIQSVGGVLPGLVNALMKPREAACGSCPCSCAVRGRRVRGQHRQLRIKGRLAVSVFVCPTGQSYEAGPDDALSLLKIASHASENPALERGNWRMRRPVAANRALATAGATGPTASSPTPPGLSPLSNMITSIFGIWANWIRR